jgi:hypothetical protein
MSATTFWGQVHECHRLLRLHRRIKDEDAKASRAWRFVRWFIPWAIVPLVALPWPNNYGTGLLGMVLFVYLIGFPPIWLTTFEALRMPSRRSLFTVRLLRALPWLLWAGFWGTAALLASGWPALQTPVQVILCLLIGAQVPVLVLGVYGALLILMRSWMWVGLTVCGGLAGFLGGAAAAFLPGQALAGFLALVAPAMLLLEVGLLALQVWGVGRLEPIYQIDRSLQGQAQKQVREKTLPVGAPPRGGVPGKLGPAPLLAGRHGLGWAAAYYALSLRGKGFRGIKEKVTIPLILLGSLFLLIQSAPGLNWVWGLFLYFCLVLGSPLHLPDPRRLYLLGVDYRRQLVHRLRTFWVTPPLLAVSAGTALAVLLWGDPELPLALLAVAAGLTLFREGWLGWPTWEPNLLGGPLGCWCSLLFLALLLWLGFLLTAGRWAWLPDPGWDTVTRALLFAAACGGCGLVGIAYKWWRYDEATLSEAMCGWPNPVPHAPGAANG